MVVTIPFIFGMYLIGYEALILLANEEVAERSIYTNNKDYSLLWF